MSQNTQPTLLVIDATMRQPALSRSWRLAQEYLAAFEKARPGWTIEQLMLRELDLRPNTMQDNDLREALVTAGDWENPALRLARQFAEANGILMVAPYWDYSFPAALRVYIEKVCVGGIAFRYTETGSVGLCRAGWLTYLTTCGGPLPAVEQGAAYLKALSQGLLGIPAFETVAAQLLDVDGVDTEAQLAQASAALRALPSLR